MCFPQNQRRSIQVLLGALAAVIGCVSLAGCGLTSATLNSSSTHGEATPQITSVSPGYLVAGTAGVVLLIQGTGFAADSTVSINNGQVASRLLRTGQLAAVVTVPSSSNSLTITASGTGGASSPFSVPVLSAGVVANTANPQVADYSIWAPPGANVAVDFGPNIHYSQSTWARPAPAAGGIVHVLVAGMKAFSPYHLRGRITLSDGSVFFDSDQVFTTGGMDQSLQPSISSATQSLVAGNGIEMFDFTTTTSKTSVVATDLSGNIIWYYDPGVAGTYVFPIRQLPNGDLLVSIAAPQNGFGTSSEIREVDLAGNIIRSVKFSDLTNALAARGYSLQLGGFHHDVIALPNGHWVALVYEFRTFTDLPNYPGQTTVRGDAIVDIDQDGQPAWVWSGFDHLDINRQPMAFPDWTHSNALIFDQNDGSLFVSMRHQSWILKLDYNNGQGSGGIIWKIGYQGDFQLAQGDASAWFYAQHFPNIFSEDASSITFGVMDNGDGRVLDSSGDQCGAAGQPSCYSRALIFKLDKQQMTMSTLWEYRPGFYSSWGGAIQLLPNGNVDVDFSQNGPNAAGGSSIFEVPALPNATPVFEMSSTGMSAYRAFRLPSLYPGVQW